jgi:hypothetical protein
MDIAIEYELTTAELRSEVWAIGKRRLIVGRNDADRFADVYSYHDTYAHADDNYAHAHTDRDGRGQPLRPPESDAPPFLRECAVRSHQP